MPQLILQFPVANNSQSEEELCARNAHQVKCKSSKQDMCEAMNFG